MCSSRLNTEEEIFPEDLKDKPSKPMRVCQVQRHEAHYTEGAKEMGWGVGDYTKACKGLYKACLSVTRRWDRKMESHCNWVGSGNGLEHSWDEDQWRDLRVFPRGDMTWKLNVRSWGEGSQAHLQVSSLSKWVNQVCWIQLVSLTLKHTLEHTRVPETFSVQSSEGVGPVLELVPGHKSFHLCAHQTFITRRLSLNYGKVTCEHNLEHFPFHSTDIFRDACQWSKNPRKKQGGPLGPFKNQVCFLIIT